MGLDDLDLSKLVAEYSFGKLYVLRMISKSVDYYFYKEFIKEVIKKAANEQEEEEDKKIIKMLSSFAAALQAPRLKKVISRFVRLRFRRTESESDSFELNSIESRSE